MVSERCRRRFSSSTLPEEIAEQIIARVPCIKTVLRCTSVCKSWYAFIHSAPFVKSLISLLASNNDVKKLLLCEFDDAINPWSRVDRIEVIHDIWYFARPNHQTSIEDSYCVSDDYFLSGDYIDDLLEARTLLEEGPYFALHDDDKDFQENCKLVFPRSNLLQLHACNGLICYITRLMIQAAFIFGILQFKEKKGSQPLFLTLILVIIMQLLSCGLITMPMTSGY